MATSTAASRHQLDNLSTQAMHGSVQSYGRNSYYYVPQDPEDAAALEEQRIRDFMEDDSMSGSGNESVGAARRRMARKIQDIDLAFALGPAGGR